MWTSEVVNPWLRAGVLAAAGLCVGTLAYRLAVVLPMAPARLGERGRRRVQWLSRGGLVPWLDVLVRQVAAWLSGRVPAHWHAWLARRLVLAGEPWGFGPAELLAASLLCGVLGGSLFAWLAVSFSSLLLAMLVPIMPLLPAWRVREEGRARVKAVERSLPIAMDLVALCVRAGSDFPAALRFVVGELRGAHPVCAHELSRIEEALALGRTRVDALQAFADRIDSPPVARFVASVVQSERRGIALSDALANQAESLRRLRSVRAEENAAKAGVRMIVPLMLMLAAILTLLLGPIALEGAAL